MEYRRYWFDNPALPLAISSAVRFFSHRTSPITVKRSTQILSSSFALRLRISQRTLAVRPKPTGSSHGLLLPAALTRLGGPDYAGEPHPPPSASRVWLPSARLTPSKPAPVFSHTGSALGIHPSELTPLTRYRAVSSSMDPLTVFPAVASVAEATGRPGRPRFLGFDPRENPWRSDAWLGRRSRWMLPWVSALPGLATGDWNGLSSALLPHAFPHALYTRGRRPGVSIDARLTR